MASSNADYGDALGDERGPLSKLDKALAGQSSDVVARIQQYAHTFDLDQDDELFAFGAAMGFLTVLIQDAPENWQVLFDEVLQDLNRWAEQNRRSLSQLAQYSDAANELSDVLKGAIEGLAASDNSRREFTRTMVKEINHNAELTKQLGREIGPQFELVSQQQQSIKKESRFMMAILGAGTAVSLLLLLISTVASVRLLGKTKVLEQELSAQRNDIGYIYQKATRAECLYGIKPSGDPDCEQYN